MLLTDLGQAKSGQRLARTIYYPDGRVILQRGTALTGSYVQKLYALGLNKVFLEQEGFEDLEPEDLLDEKTKLQAVQATRKAFANTERKPLDAAQIKTNVYNVLDSVQDAKDFLVSTMELWPAQDYLYAHSVNVCVLSLLLGKKLNYPERKLRDLGVGALLHDIGLAMRGMVDQNGIKVENEDHTWAGFEKIRSNRELSILSATVALQHHERLDGTGYPRGISDEIHEFSRIVSIADTYDSLTNVNKLLPHEALEVITALSSKNILDLNLVEELLKVIAIYPIGVPVQLNTGEKGVVIKQNPKIPSRPVVLVTEK
jgi:putative nucleotidyltransferase with HDIG domain